MKNIIDTIIHPEQNFDTEAFNDSGAQFCLRIVFFSQLKYNILSVEKFDSWQSREFYGGLIYSKFL